MAGEISVLMPVKNGEKTIRSALKSTLLALGKRDEILIMLDGCTDNTKVFVQEFADNRIRIFENRESQGVGNSLNTLLSASRFDLVARMDADDVCFPWRFVIQKRILLKTSSDFVFSTHFLFGKGLTPPVRPAVITSLDNNECMIALAVSNPFIHPSVIMKKTSIQKLGGYRNCPAEDYDLWLRASLENFKLARNWLPCVAIRVHNTQITQDSVWRKNLDADLELKAKLFDLRSRLLPQVRPGSGSLKLEAASQMFTSLETLVFKQRWIVKKFLARNLRKVIK